MSNSKQQTNPKLQQGSSSNKSKLPSTTRSAVQSPKGNEPGSPIDVSSDVDSPEQTEAYTFSDKALKKMRSTGIYYFSIGFCYHC